MKQRALLAPGVALLLLVSVAGAPHAQTTSSEAESDAESDWGVTIDADSTVRTADHLEQDIVGRSLGAAIWGRRVSPLGTEGSLDISAQGSYNWSRALVYVDLDLARITTRLPGALGGNSVLEARAGRFRFSDPGAQVLSHTADGVSLNLLLPAATFRVATAYTGLLINPTSQIRMSAADLSEEDDQDEFWGPRRAVAASSVTLRDLPGRQQLDLSVVGQLDLRDADETEDTINSGYVTLGLSGPLMRNVYHDLYATYTMGRQELGSEDQDYSGLLASARVRVFVPAWWSTRISLRGAYAGPGFGDDETDGFVPVSRRAASAVIALPLQNLMMAEATWSVRPVPTVQLRAGGRAFFLPSDQPVVVHEGLEPDGDGPVGIQPEPEGSLVGYEGALGITYRMTSDLGFGVNGAIFFPETGSNGVFTNERKPEFSGRLEMSLRL